MSEPLEEEVEESWLVFLNRFEQEIYPTLFEPRGYTKPDAMIVWTLSRMETTLDEIKEALAT